MNKAGRTITMMMRMRMWNSCMCQFAHAFICDQSSGSEAVFGNA